MTINRDKRENREMINNFTCQTVEFPQIQLVISILLDEKFKVIVEIILTYKRSVSSTEVNIVKVLDKHSSDKILLNLHFKVIQM